VEVTKIAKTPENYHFRLHSDQVLDIFQKNSKRMRWTLLEYFFKTNKLQLISFLISKIFRLFTGWRAFFAKDQVHKNQTQVEIAFVVNLFDDDDDDDCFY